MGGVAMKNCLTCENLPDLEKCPPCQNSRQQTGIYINWELIKRTKPTGIEAMVCADIAERQKLGLAKYNTTLADNPLVLKEWLEHQYLELLDAALYCKRAIVQIETKESKHE
jgi:hypothetical protein